MLLGLMAGTLVTLLYDKSKGKVFELNNLDKLFNCKSIINLYSKNKEEFKETIELISLTKLSKLKGNLCVLPLGDISSDILDLFKHNFDNQLSELKISFIKDLKELIKFKNVIVLISRGDIKHNQLISYSQNLAFIENPIFAIMVIENSESLKEI